jgi:hypothetical protein
MKYSENIQGEKFFGNVKNLLKSKRKKNWKRKKIYY